MILRFSVLLTIFTVFSHKAIAQDYYPPVVNYSTHDYGKDRNPENFCVIQDRRGVMYFGNSNGLIEYDGNEWRFVKTIPGSFVRSMAMDSTGVIYVGTYGDFGYIEANEFGETEYVSLLDKVSEDDAFFSEIWTIHATSTHVYFQSYESFFAYNLVTKSVKCVYPEGESSFHLAFMVDGVLHLKSRGIGIVKYQNEELVKLEGTDPVKDLGVFGIYHLEDDSLLMITQEIGLWKYARGAMRQLPEVNSTPLTEIGIYGSMQLSNRNYVLTTFSNGMYVINDKGKVVKTLNRHKGLRSNDLKSVFQDRDRNLWLALGNGISKVNHHSPLSYFDEKAGIEGDVQCITRFKDEVFVGTSLGLFKKGMASENTKEFLNINLIKNQVWDFETVDEQLYIATSEGVYASYDGKSFRKVADIPVNVIRYHPYRSKFICGSSFGIYVFTKDFRVDWKVDDDSFSRFLSCEIDPNNTSTVWLGSSNSGAYRLQFEGDEVKYDHYGFFDGLNDNELTKPLLHDSKLIFGTTQGILSFIHEDEMVLELPDSLKNDPQYHRGMFQTEDFHDSTFSNTVLLVEDEDDRTWYCAEDKIGYYDKQEKVFKNKPFWGIDFGRVNEFYMEGSGVLWIGCADGLIRYERNELKVYESHFYSLIRSFTINRDSVIFNGAFSQSGIMQASQPDSSEVVLDYEFNDVKFNFAAPYFEDDHKPEYSFFLEGLDESWSNWSTNTEANFTNLLEGDYIFRVKARNIYGTMSEEAQFKFTVLPPWYRTTWSYILYAIGFIIIFFVGFRLFSLRLKRQNIRLEGIVEERTKEIREKNHILKEQKQEIEDSINYAQRIQEAILPLETEMKQWLPNSFVLFRPKDIVSGDFYWFKEVDGKLVFICADCTGHGVPGAFMSMIGSDRLQIIVEERKILDPGKILSELNIAIKMSLKQDGHTGSTKDGMDAAVCTIDLETKELRYAGANRPLWILKKNQVEIEEIKATKVAVAGFTPDDQIYETHVINIEQNMKFYMTSDGYADQFGGVKGKKLKVKTLKKFILDVCNKEFGMQKDELEQSLIQWMDGYEQIDDVCVVGFEPVR